jgi:acyl carrier protein
MDPQHRLLLECAIEQVGIHDNFFELGGHSLLGLQLVSRLQETFAVEVPLGVIFEALTIAELAMVVSTAQQDGLFACDLRAAGQAPG